MNGPKDAGPGGSEHAWDAGDLGCGELLLALKVRLAGLRAGDVLDVTARDPGAREDLPSWCAQTGHALLLADPPRYRIRKRTP